MIELGATSGLRLPQETLVDNQKTLINNQVKLINRRSTV